jgi:DNA-binding transcriptional regulator YdaS (Cro superfamily)
MPQTSPVERALRKFDGSTTRMARALGGSVLRQHVEHWAKSGRIPTEHCRAVQELTGVPCWEFRPDDWYRIWPDLIGSKGAPKMLVEASAFEVGKRSPSTHPGERAGDKQVDR